jgi:hypothetical protein
LQGVISRASVSLIIRTGGVQRALRQDLHFSDASSFHKGVSRGRRMASSGLARVLQRLHFYLQPAQPAVEALGFVGDGWAGPSVVFHAQRPRICLRAIGLTGAFVCVFPGLPRAYVGAHDLGRPR